jgi:hypothetical protein
MPRFDFGSPPSQVTLAKYVTIGFSPFVASYMHRHGYFSRDGAVYVLKYAAGLVFLYYSAVVVRGVGRYLNKEYMAFRNVLDKVTSESPEETVSLSFARSTF